jgi:hypothetical protein
VLLADPARTEAAPLIERLVVDRAAQALWRRAALAELKLAELL